MDAGGGDACGAARRAEQGKEKGEADGWARRGIFFLFFFLGCNTCSGDAHLLEPWPPICSREERREKEREKRLGKRRRKG